jgi:FixJ family two-component response regulator
MSDRLRHVIDVVDDDPRILEALGELLESKGYLVNLYTSGQLLLDDDEEHGDCLITDLGMPGIDGFELCRRLRLTNPNLPVIFMTARNGIHDQKRADRFEHHGLLQKPFDAATLLASVESAIRSRS